MRSSVFLLSLFIGTNAILCPYGYSDGGDGSCYSGNIGSAISRNDAYNLCLRNKSYIPDISNAFQNTAFMNSFGSVEFAWLGLTCLNNSMTSCLWDTGIPMTSLSYSNFNGGSPNPQNGPCVWMDVKSGKWYSADCTNDFAYFGCKYTSTINVPYCDYETPFRGKCYYAVWTNAGSSEDSTKYCTLYGSLQASIHSVGENVFIKSLAAESQGETARSQLFLGIQYSSSWTDGTILDYTNYGYKNSKLGLCNSMSLYDGLVPAGQWISSPCSSSNVATVCKRDAYTPQPPPTMSPPQCNGTQFLIGSGTVYSPGYPLGSEANNCEYLFIGDSGKLAQISLSVQLDRYSTLQLFSGEFNASPFQTLRNTVSLLQTYNSTTNMLRIIYTTKGTDYQKNL